MERAKHEFFEACRQRGEYRAGLTASLRDGRVQTIELQIRRPVTEEPPVEPLQDAPEGEQLLKEGFQWFRREIASVNHGEVSLDASVRDGLVRSVQMQSGRLLR